MKMPKNVDLSGKVAVVTGAGGVLCSEMARAVAAAGAAVALVDINYPAIKALEEELTAQGRSALAVEAQCFGKRQLGSGL